MIMEDAQLSEAPCVIRTSSPAPRWQDWGRSKPDWPEHAQQFDTYLLPSRWGLTFPFQKPTPLEAAQLDRATFAYPDANQIYHVRDRADGLWPLLRELYRLKLRQDLRRPWYCSIHPRHQRPAFLLPCQETILDSLDRVTPTPFVFIARAAAPILPGWLGWLNTTRTLSSGHGEFILECHLHELFKLVSELICIPCLTLQ